MFFVVAFERRAEFVQRLMLVERTINICLTSLMVFYIRCRKLFEILKIFFSLIKTNESHNCNR